MKALAYIVFSLLICVQAIAQTKAKRYINKGETLINNITNLRYDSVKVYSFDCGPVVSPKGYIFMTFDGKMPPGEPLIDSIQHWNPKLSDSGKVVEKIDIHYIKSILERSYTDEYKNTVRSCYSPRMGIAFFKNGIVVGHIDVCMECKKAVFEKFNNGKIRYHYEWEELGKRMLKLFKSVCLKYKLHCCDTP